MIDIDPPVCWHGNVPETACCPAVVSQRALLADGTQLVILWLLDDFRGLDMVGSDSYGGTLQALNYLYELGHRRIGFIRGEHRGGRGHARHRAYADFLHQAGLPFDPSLVVEAAVDLAGGSAPRGCPTAACRARSGSPTADRDRPNGVPSSC